MNVRERKDAVLLRQGWTIEQIQRRRVAARWKMLGLCASAAMYPVPVQSVSNAGLMGLCICVAALIIGASHRV